MFEFKNRSGLILLSALAIFSFTGVDCSLLYNPPQAITSATELSDKWQFNSPGLVYNCGAIPTSAYVQPTMWSFSNNTTGSILWPKGGAGVPNPILLYFNSPMSSQSVTAYQQAYSAWNTFLQNQVALTGNYIEVTYQVTNNSDAANIQLYDSTYEAVPGNIDGTIPGADEFTSIVNNFSTLDKAFIVIEQEYDPTTAYVLAAHELGHTLGLAHSPYQSSVMFPTLNNVACIKSAGNSNFDPTDATWLKGVYDPRYATPNPNKRCTHNCGLVATKAFDRFALQDNAKRANAIMRAASISLGIPGHPKAHWVSTEDPLGASRLSLSSLILSSTLAAHVKVLREIGIHTRPPLRTVYKEAIVSQIIRHMYGPDAALRNNDKIIIGDTEMANGEELLDSLSLNASDNPVVFLQRSNETITFYGQKYPVYYFTARWVSKMSLSRTATLVPMSVKDSRIAHEVFGTRIDTLLNRLSPGSVSGNVLHEDIFMHGLLRNVGVQSDASIRSYTHTMTLNSRLILQALAAKDRAMQIR